MEPPVFGVVGWKNSGKTTLMSRLIEEFTERAYKVAAVKHAHHAFDVDQPGRDSYKIPRGWRAGGGGRLCQAGRDHARIARRARARA